MLGVPRGSPNKLEVILYGSLNMYTYGYVAKQGDPQNGDFPFGVPLKQPEKGALKKHKPRYIYLRVCVCVCVSTGWTLSWMVLAGSLHGTKNL